MKIQFLIKLSEEGKEENLIVSHIYLPSSLTLTVTLYREQMKSSPHDNWHFTMSFNKWSTAPWSTKAWAWWVASK